MRHLWPHLVVVELLAPAMAAAAGVFGWDPSADGEECLAVAHDLGIEIERAGAVTRLAAHAFLLAEARRKEGVVVLSAGDVAEETAVV